MKIKKIISGGQTGVERAALDVALALGIPCGGWCPKGREAEDGPIDTRYPLQETDSTDYRGRTEKNVQESDGTLILTTGVPKGGTSLTTKLAEKYKKPRLSINLSKRNSPSKCWNWIQEKKIETLNVAGPRESEAPGIYERAAEFLWRMVYGPKVKQRTKKDSVIIEGLFRIKSGSLIMGQQMFKKTSTDSFDTAKLKVIASPSDWQKLWSYCLNYGDDLAQQFWENFIHPAMAKLETTKGARGRYKNSKEFVDWIKTESSFLYAFFSYWCKQPFDKWPDYLKALVDLAENDGFVIPISKAKSSNPLLKNIMGRGTKTPYRLTRYCVEKAYGEILKSYRLRLFDDPSNFLKNYIHSQGKSAQTTKFFIKGKSPQEISDLVCEPPLNNIFKRLRII